MSEARDIYCCGCQKEVTARAEEEDSSLNKKAIT